MTNEQAERFLGTLIRLLNPYTKTMYYPPNKPQADFEARRKALEAAVDKPDTEDAREVMLEEVRKVLEAEKARCRALEAEEVNKPDTEDARKVRLEEVRKVLEAAVNKPDTEDARKVMLEEVRKVLEAEEGRRKALEAEEGRRKALQTAVNDPESKGAPKVILEEVRKVLKEARRALADAREVLQEFDLEVDNRYGSQNGGNYLSWEFKGQPQTVKKAVRIQFRHPVAEGVWITDHLLVGYAGSNGP
jgi:colicin import membrane protein